MPDEKQKKESNVELRQDLLTKEWILVYTGGKESLELIKETDSPKKKKKNKEDCPYCEFKNPEYEKLVYADNNGNWSLKVVSNENSILNSSLSKEEAAKGPYVISNGNGIHEYVITRSHDKELWDLEELAVAEIIDSLTDRYLGIMKEKNVKYISIVKNYGNDSRSIIDHPHINIYGFPFIPTRIHQELDGMRNYYKENKRCPHCVMIEHELESKRERIITENDDFVSLCPFTSRSAFETRILPKDHKPYFERLTNKEKINLAKILQDTLEKIKITLNEPAFSLYLQTSPCGGEDYGFNHWNIVILPKAPIIPKFELGVEIDINIIKPKEAAEYLRKSI